VIGGRVHVENLWCLLVGSGRAEMDGYRRLKEL
jgi:hypothetical protein